MDLQCSLCEVAFVRIMSLIKRKIIRNKNKLTMIRPSILTSFCSKSQIWIRAFWNQNFQTKKESNPAVKNRNNNKTLDASFMKKPKWWNQPNKAKRRTYTLQEPENQVLKHQNPRRKKHKTLWNSTKKLNKTQKRKMEKTTYNGLSHDPLNFGARHDCKNAKGFWVAERGFSRRRLRRSVVANLEGRAMPIENKVIRDWDW